MDKDEYKDRIKKQIEVMEAYLEGKDIQVSYGGGIWEDTEHPEWTWDVIKYRVKPDEVDEPKKLMTYRQLSELMAKGYGELRYRHNLLVKTHFKYDVNNENKTKDDVLIRPWGSDEWLEPTVDIYEEYISKWNKAFKEIEVKVVFPKKEEEDTINDYSNASRIDPKVGEVFKYNGMTLKCVENESCIECAFQKDFPQCPNSLACNGGFRKDGKSVVFVDVSKMENTTASEDSSATVSKEESVGVHRRTPQEFADFFNCYVAMDKDGMWCLYVEEPTIVTVIKDGWRLKNPRRDSFLFIKDAFLSKPNTIDWRTLYRPHMEPLVMEEDDD